MRDARFERIVECRVGARDRIRTGEPLQEQILSLSPLAGACAPLTELGYPRVRADKSADLNKCIRCSGGGYLATTVPCQHAVLGLGHHAFLDLHQNWVGGYHAVPVQHLQKRS